MSLTKDDVVKALAKENGYQLNHTVELIETLFKLIKSTLASGEDMMLEARRVVTFRCSRQLRDKING